MKENKFLKACINAVTGLEVCPICKEPCEELIDTEGMVNGGIGNCCEGCKEDLDIKEQL